MCYYVGEGLQRTLEMNVEAAKKKRRKKPAWSRFAVFIDRDGPNRVFSCYSGRKKNKSLVEPLWTETWWDRWSAAGSERGEGRERVKRLRLPDNPQPLKALQKDVTCVR